MSPISATCGNTLSGPPPAQPMPATASLGIATRACRNAMVSMYAAGTRRTDRAAHTRSRAAALALHALRGGLDPLLDPVEEHANSRRRGTLLRVERVDRDRWPLVIDEHGLEPALRELVGDVERVDVDHAEPRNGGRALRVGAVRVEAALQHELAIVLEPPRQRRVAREKAQRRMGAQIVGVLGPAVLREVLRRAGAHHAHSAEVARHQLAVAQRRQPQRDVDALRDRIDHVIANAEIERELALRRVVVGLLWVVFVSSVLCWCVVV